MADWVIALVFVVINKATSLPSFYKTIGGTNARYARSSQLTNDENEDIDSLNCQVKSSGVRGLFTIMENIIMVDKSNNIWTAVINTEDEKVYYFTNTQRFKDQLPKTIEKWRENFKEKEVIYKNK